MKSSYFYLIVSLKTLLFSTVRAQVEPCLINPIFSDTCCPVLLNEILPEGYDGETWAELYSCRSDTVDLSGWFLTDTPADSLKFELQSFQIPPQTFVVLTLPFTISRSIGLLQLWSSDSTFSYGVTFNGLAVGESIGYCGKMLVRQTPSPGTQNSCTLSTSLDEVSEDSFQNKKPDYFYDILGRCYAYQPRGFSIAVFLTEKGYEYKKIYTY